MTSDSDYALVPLSSQKYPGLVAVIDPEMVELVNQYKWHPERKNQDIFYASSADIYMHNLVTGWPRVDHVDGDGLNNRRSNLRPATHIENARNQGLQRNNTSGYKGVTTLGDNKWRARITVNGVRNNLGNYDTPEQAAIAYDRAARKAFGKFGRYNFPRTNEQGAR